MQNLRRPGDGMFTIVCGISDGTPCLQQFNPLAIGGELCMPGWGFEQGPRTGHNKFRPNMGVRHRIYFLAVQARPRTQNFEHVGIVL